MIKTKLVLLLISLIAQSWALADSAHYQSIKDDINRIENSVILNFQFVIPEKGSELHNSSALLKLKTEIDKAFENQLKSFQEAETALFFVKELIDTDSSSNKLTKKESKKLISNMEYARRIILNSRKSEIVRMYFIYKEQLQHSPTLSYFFEEISKVKLPGTCEMSNIKLDGDELSFQVSNNKKGRDLKTQHYKINKSDITLGALKTTQGYEEALGKTHKTILSFRVTTSDLSVKAFNIFENKKGEFYHAEFSHEDKKAPFIKLFGHELGVKKISEHIICNDNITETISLKELERDRIRKQYEQQVSIKKSSTLRTKKE